MSDLHFFAPSYSLAQFGSKRWLGNLNALAHRKGHFSAERLDALIPFLATCEPTHVAVTGDMTTTSRKVEFQRARDYLSRLESKLQIPLFTLPGNHDTYTRSAFKTQQFYDYFPNHFGDQAALNKAMPQLGQELIGLNLKRDGITLVLLQEHASLLILLDTAIATSCISSAGCFSQRLDRYLKTICEKVPHDRPILCMNHYPFLSHERPRRRLRRADRLCSILRESMKRRRSPIFYLHGHTHTQSVSDLRQSQLPITLDSGSTGHQSSPFLILELSAQTSKVTTYGWTDKSWLIQQELELTH